jgi:UTP--glucose-1-phosphate uridylyltransferase
MPRAAARTAIIAAAGSASRMWPASKVCPKEMFPIGRLPVIAHLVWEMVDAGIPHIVIVVRKDSFRGIEAVFDPAIAPPASVARDPLVRRFEKIIRKPRFTFVEQSGPYGNGTPLLNGFAASDGGPCIYAFADDVVFGENVTAGLIRTYRRTGHVVLAAQRVPKKETSRFGILETRRRGGEALITRFVEKPKAGATTSALASLGRYLVTREVVDVLEQTPVGRDRELWLADAFCALLDRHSPLSAFTLTKGRWYTVGNPDGYRNAVLAGMRMEQRDDLYSR